MVPLRAVFLAAVQRHKRGLGDVGEEVFWGVERWGVALGGLFGDKCDIYADSNVTSILGMFWGKKQGGWLWLLCANLCKRWVRCFWLF